MLPPVYHIKYWQLVFPERKMGQSRHDMWMPEAQISFFPSFFISHWARAMLPPNSSTPVAKVPSFTSLAAQCFSCHRHQQWPRFRIQVAMKCVKWPVISTTDQIALPETADCWQIRDREKKSIIGKRHKYLRQRRTLESCISVQCWAFGVRHVTALCEICNS